MVKRISYSILAICLVFLSINYNKTKAYTDLSTYKIQTGDFATASIANTNLKKFKEQTGWSAIVQEKDSLRKYYQVLSGGFRGEDRVQSVLANFKSTTGINGTYEGIGDPIKYYQVTSGGFRSKSQIEAILMDFQNSTGINADYIGVGDKENYYQVFSGGFPSEDRVQSVLEQFKKYTGLPATYVGIGSAQKYYQIISGAFIGEQRAIQVLNDFKNSTGISASYEGVTDPQPLYEVLSGGFKGEAKVSQVINQLKQSTGLDATAVNVGNDTYKIKVTSILGTTNLNKVKDFFVKNNWYYSVSSLGTTGYEKYRIKSVPVLGIETATKGKNFFINNGWYVSTPQTGEVGYTSYRIETEPLLGLDKAGDAKNFFVKNNWYVSVKSTGETDYSVYKVQTEPLLGLTLVLKAKKYFTDKNWYVSAKETGKVGYSSYRIRSSQFEGEDKLNKARSYFTNNNWFVTYSSETKTVSRYQILTGGFPSYDRAQQAIAKINNLFGWSATAVKVKNGPKLMYTDYGLTLTSMLNQQMERSPQTDKYRNEARYIHADYVDLAKQVVTGDSVNVRTGPNTSSTVTQKVDSGTKVQVIAKTGDWVEVRMTWQNATSSDVNTYLNPNNFSMNNKEYFQFLKLSQPAGLQVSEVNEKILAGKGVLTGKAQAFIDAANKYNINEVYLISHSLLETGNGLSQLATGVEYNGKTVYNMYGYGAYDSCALTCGAQKAYESGWFTPEAAIIGGAQLISSEYIYNSAFQQDTLYKMRWNPVQTWHQYATDIGWAYKQVNSIYNLYQLLDNYTLYYDVASYR
ncbi:Beta-N-acetylglucosaminidase precursor [Mycobacteroides abscessus subsp. abscessus]|nr:Beta-N-acetylglucosaminidase precursor [Mycobacteroides abscessus subsp. abscessus]